MIDENEDGLETNFSSQEYWERIADKVDALPGATNEEKLREVTQLLREPQAFRDPDAILVAWAFATTLLLEAGVRVTLSRGEELVEFEPPRRRRR